jgi:hypothetical protein
MVRDLEPGDIPQLKDLHQRIGMDYQFPDFDQPLFSTRKVYCDEDGRIIGAGFLKIQAEAYLMIEPSLDPTGKLAALAEISPAIEESAWSLGLDTLTAYIPEAISLRFAKRLKALGWDKARNGWITWFRELSEG